MPTNANNAALADLLADAKLGTFTGLVVPKKGVTRGGKANPVVYGNDVVYVSLVTGFRYITLVVKSKAKALLFTDADKDGVAALGLTGWERVWKKSAKVAELAEVCTTLGLDATGGKKDLVARLEAHVPGGVREVAVTREHVDAAYEALLADLDRTLNKETKPTTADVFEPLVVNGEKVRGARVYTGNDNGEDAAEPGTIYLHGLLIGSRVLTPAPNGPVPAAKSTPVNAAKKALRSKLPISRYVSYVLEPGTDFVLAAGATAAAAADGHGITVDADRVREVKEMLGAA